MRGNQGREYQYSDGLRHCFSWAYYSYNALTPFMFGSSGGPRIGVRLAFTSDSTLALSPAGPSRYVFLHELRETDRGAECLSRIGKKQLNESPSMTLSDQTERSNIMDENRIAGTARN